jgi:hypothetical protein
MDTRSNDHKFIHYAFRANRAVDSCGPHIGYLTDPASSEIPSNCKDAGKVSSSFPRYRLAFFASFRISHIVSLW